MNVAEMRRRAVMRAVAAVFDRGGGRAGMGGGVLPFHVRYFGIEECVPEPLPKIAGDLRWLAERGYVTRGEGWRRGRPVEYEPTDEGRAWVA